MGGEGLGGGGSSSISLVRHVPSQRECVRNFYFSSFLFLFFIFCDGVLPAGLWIIFFAT